MTQTSDFLPVGYETPSSGGAYMKFETGDNDFRILSKPIMGWIYWNTASKPVRINSPAKNKPVVDVNLIQVDKQGKRDLKFFWAMIIYNYKASSIQILEISQVSIQRGMEEFFKNPKWGSPFNYDINIKKTVEKEKTSYQVMPTPPSIVSEDVKKAYFEKQPINLEALFEGKDPFADTKSTPVAPTPVLVPTTNDLPF